MIGSSPVLVRTGNTKYSRDLYKGEIWKNEKRLSAKSRPPDVVRMITPPTGNTVQTTDGYYDVEVSEHDQHLFIGANTKPWNILNDSLQYTFASQNIRTKSLYIYIQTEHTHIKY